MHKSLVPDFMLGYSCVMCGNCCTGWNIPIDELAYNKLKSIFQAKNIPLQKLDENIIKNTGENDNGYFAFLRQKESRCGFLEPNGLCFIHKELGEEYLPAICKMYPRVLVKTPRGREYSLTFSCPAAVSKLNRKESIKIVENPELFRVISGGFISGTMKKEFLAQSAFHHEYFFLEKFIIEILQNRFFDIEERLVLLGVILRKIINLQYNKRFKQKLTKIYEEYKNIHVEEFKGQYRSIPLKVEYQVNALKLFINLEFVTSIKDKTVQTELTGLVGSFFGNRTVDEIVRDYRKNIHFYLRPVKPEIAHILENYLVNFVLGKKFAQHSFTDAYYLMVFFYSIIRGLGIIMAHLQRTMVTEEILLKAIFLVGRGISHSYNYYNELLAELKKHGHTDIAHTIALVRI